MVILNHKWVQDGLMKISSKKEMLTKKYFINKYQKDANMFADGITGNSNEMYEYGIFFNYR